MGYGGVVDPEIRTRGKEEEGKAKKINQNKETRWRKKERGGGPDHRNQRLDR